MRSCSHGDGEDSISCNDDLSDGDLVGHSDGREDSSSSDDDLSDGDSSGHGDGEGSSSSNSV